MTTSLSTERLVLRPFVPEDSAAVSAQIDNWNVARWLAVVPYPYPRSAARTWIAKQDALAAAGDGFAFAITEGDEIIGCVGLERTEPGAMEMGYWLAEPFWGRGLASEAVRAVTRFGFAEIGIDRILASHFEGNAASARVL